MKGIGGNVESQRIETRRRGDQAGAEEGSRGPVRIGERHGQQGEHGRGPEEQDEPDTDNTDAFGHVHVQAAQPAHQREQDVGEHRHLQEADVGVAQPFQFARPFADGEPEQDAANQTEDDELEGRDGETADFHSRCDQENIAQGAIWQQYSPFADGPRSGHAGRQGQGNLLSCRHER